MNPSETPFFVTGGTLPKDAPSYVSRHADKELLEGLRGGEFCYVLTSRQMGKSSLMVRAAVRLQAEGVAVAVVDLTALGQTLTVDQWYGGLLRRIGRQLGLEDDLEAFWTSRGTMGALERWMAAIREVVLKWRPGKVVIFIDEIDVVRSLPFSTDEFFAAIRECYNNRVRDPELTRLTFCLLGVAAPSDLIRDTRMTPFNIGKRIELHDFSEAEAAPLAKGLNEKGRPGAMLLARIHFWTSGHPYLTQKLCRETADDPGVRTAAHIDRLCESRFFSNRARQDDDNLLFVRERLLRSDVDLAGLLELYRSIRSHKGVLDDESNPLVTTLRLSGVVKSEGGRLRVRNRIYERVFDKDWIFARMPDAEVRRQRIAFRKGVLRTALVSTGLMGVMGVLIGMVVSRAHEAEQKRDELRHLVYVSSIGSAFSALQSHNTARARLLIDSVRPPGKPGFAWSYIWHRIHRSILTLDMPGLNNYGLQYSPDGKSLAVGSGDGKVRMWDLRAGKMIQELNAGGSPIIALSSWPRGNWLAAGGHNGQITVWDWQSGRQLRKIQTEHFLHSLCFSPDGRILVTGHGQGIVQVWDTLIWRRIKTVRGPSGSVATIAFSPDGNRVLMDSIAGGFQLWNLSTWKMDPLPAFKSGVAAAYSPDGEWLCIAEDSGGVFLWNTKKHRIRRLDDPEKTIATSLSFSPDGLKLAAGGIDTAIRVWNLTADDKPEVLEGHMVRVTNVAFSPRGNGLASRDWTGNVRVWRADNLTSFVRLKDKRSIFNSAAFALDGSLLASLDSEFRLTGWDTFTGSPVATMGKMGPDYSGSAFSPDNRQLLIATNRGTVESFDTRTGERIGRSVHAIQGLRSLAVSPDGRTIAGGLSDGHVVLWDQSTPEKFAQLCKHSQSISAVAFSALGSDLVSGSWDGSAQIWDLHAHRQLALFDGQLKEVRSVAISPDGQTVATGGAMGQVRLWDLATGRELFTISAGPADILAIVFSIDGSTLAAIDSSGLITRWRSMPASSASGQASNPPTQQPLAQTGKRGETMKWLRMKVISTFASTFRAVSTTMTCFRRGMN